MKTKQLLFSGIIFFSIASLALVEEDFLLFLNEKLEQHYKNYPQVKIHLFFNQEKYTSGDTAYYKVRFLSDELRPIKGKQLLKLELIDAENKIAQVQNFIVTDGEGNNQLAISSDLPSGIYTIMAYNSWMRNFNSEFIFSKRIIISGKNEFALKSLSQTDLSFFPEGNHLIANISNKVVVRASKNEKTSGQILENNVAIRDFTTDELGFAFFIFTPELGKVYKARLEGGNIDYNLPTSEVDGCTLLTTATKDVLQVILTAPKKSTWRNQELYLVMSAHGKIYYSAAYQFGDKESLSVLIPQKNIPAGSAFISLFSSNGVSIAERLVYNDVSTEIKVKITSVKNSYRPREKVNLEVSIIDEFGNPMRSDMAVSAVSKKLFSTDIKTTFPDELYLLSEFPDESFSINRNSPNWQESLDNFMITQKLKRHNWKEVLFGRKKELQYGFRNTLNLEGVVVYKETGKPLPDSTLLMVYLQNHMIGYEARTRKNGRIDLPFLFDFWGKDKIFYTLEINNKEVKNAEIRLKADSIPKISQYQHIDSQKPDIYSDFIKKRNLINRSFNYFSADNTSNKTEITNPNALFEDEVMGADIVVDVSRYIVFPTMEDLIREVIPSLIHRKSGGKPIVRIVLSPAGAMPTGDPLYMIDGVMTKSTEYFLKLKPADVLTVKVVKEVGKLSNLGALGKNGIVFIQTKRPESIKLLSADATLPIEGLSKPVKFFIPDYNVDGNKRERIPDFRSTLYWNPTVKTDASGKALVNFYSSDDLGLVKIIVNGMTADGRPFSAETEVDITMQSNLK